MLESTLGLLIEILFEFLFEVVVHGIWNGFKRVWWLITGQTHKRQASLASRRQYHEMRGAAVDKLKSRRRARKKKR